MCYPRLSSKRCTCVDWSLNIRAECYNPTVLGGCTTRSTATEDLQRQGYCPIFTPNINNAPDILGKMLQLYPTDVTHYLYLYDGYMHSTDDRGHCVQALKKAGA